MQFIFDNFAIIWFCVAFWVFGISTFTHYRNKRNGLYFEEPTPETIIYSESYASGRSHKSSKTKLGGASNCLKVIITPTHLFLRPLFPLIILGPHFDLIHVIPLSKITGIEKSIGFITGGLDIVYLNEEMEKAKFTIMSRRQTDLNAVLTKAKEEHTQ